MKLSLSWLLDYLVGAGEPAELAARLTAVGMNVELREPVAQELSGGAPQPPDEVWDVDITSNRPDVLSHRGLAREAAAAGCGTLKTLPLRLVEGDAAVAGLARVTVEDAGGCPRYCARVITGVRVAPSPQWLAARLERCGLRPINNVVDATNYVLLAIGHPLHGFDLDRLAGHEIVVRRARSGERITTLDGVDRELALEDLVIADAERPVAVAGVMGGAATEITAGTVNVLLESAYFDPGAVRRTAQRLGLSTEASQRFEKGADRAAAREAVDQAAELIAALAGGEIASGVLDSCSQLPPAPRVAFSASALSRFAGHDIPAEYAFRVLDALGFMPEGGGDRITCTVPSFRVDVELPEDLYEEVLRHYGFDRIPSALPVFTVRPGTRLGTWPLTERGRDALVSAGLAEAVTYSFVTAELEAATAGSPLAARGTAVQLANPLSARMAVMRRSILAGLVEAAAENLRRGAERVALGEVGRVFFLDGDHVREEERLAVVLAGKVGGWDEKRSADFLDLKGVLEVIFEQLGLAGLTWQPGAMAVLARGEAAEVVREGQIVAVAGRLADEVAAAVDAPLPLLVAELELARAGQTGQVSYQALGRFPAVLADLTVRHKVELTWAGLEAAVREAAPEWLESVSPVVRYQGEGVAAGEVKTTLRLTYRMADRSLTQEEVNRAHFTLMESLSGALGVSFQ
jgi:phenylalanyl-tRNA synthetase beta chain